MTTRTSKRERPPAEPRPFRAQLRAGELLAIEPRALDFSYLYTGVQPSDRTEDNIAIVRINGPLEHHATFWWDSYESILERVEDAMTGNDICRAHEYRNGWKEGFEPMAPIPAAAVVLCIDSPGGEAAGATYAHRKLKKLRAKYNVPLYAYANEMAASAAYELACAADEIWLPDTGTVGSIGVIATLYDRTAQNERIGLAIELITSGTRKADNHADRELDDDIRGRMRDRVMKLAHVFWRVVAKARGVSPAAVASLQAGVFVGQDAVDVGIADGVCGWDRFLRTVSQTLNDSPVIAPAA
jgi:hypothetical protein